MTRPVFLGALTPLMAVVIVLIWPNSPKPNWLTADDIQAFEWFSSLGLPSSRGLQPVEVWTGIWRSSSATSNRREPATVLGFLVSLDRGELTFLSLALSLSKHQEDTGSTSPYPVRFRARTMDHVTASFLTERMASRYDDGVHDTPPVSIGFRDFLTAWHCWTHDRPDLAAKFLARTKLNLHATNTAVAGAATPLQQRIFAEAAQFAFRYTLAAFSDPALSRSDLIVRLRNFIAKMPGAAEARQAKQLIADLQSLVDEEAEHPLLSDAQIEKLPRAAAGVEYVRQLRNSGLPVIDPRSSSRGRLLSLGTSAVPALLTAVDDHRASRSVSIYHRGESAVYLNSIGQAAVYLLEEISGRKFIHRGPISVDQPSPSHPSDLRLEIERWWSEYSRPGERSQMIEAVASGSADYCWHVNRLIDQYPADAGSAIVAGYSQLRDPGEKVKFLSRLDGFNDPQCIALLRRESASGEHFRIKELATEILQSLKPVEPLH